MSNKKFSLSPLAVALLMLAQPAVCWSMQALEDSELAQTTGQDGIDITLKNTGMSFDSLYWQDNTGTAGDRRLQFNNVQTVHPTTVDGVLESNLQLQFGSNAGKAGLDLLLQGKTGSLTTVDSLSICDGTGANCGKTFGALGLLNAANTTLHITTTDGLFNKDESASITLQIPDLSIFLQHDQTGAVPDQNQLMARLRLNAQADGNLWIDDVEGFRFAGDVELKSQSGALGVTDMTNNGLSLGLYTRDNAAITAKQFDTADAHPIIQLGLNGHLINTELYLRGTNDTDDYLGTGIIGSSGIALRAKADLANSDLAGNGGKTSFSLDLGEGGVNGTGVRFSKWVAFDDPSKNATLDTGNVYINMATAKDLLLPTSPYVQDAPAASTLAEIKRYGRLGVTLDGNNNFAQTLDTIEDALLVAVRGLELQGFATRSQFVGNGFTLDEPQSWALGAMLYGVNANVALWGDDVTASGSTRERIGFDIGLSTVGRNEDGTKTTSLMLMDTTGSQANYIGLRNIDSLIRAQGSLELNSGALRLNLPQFMIAVSGELAVGCLPNRPCGSGAVNQASNFDDTRDTLMGVSVKLQSKAGGSDTNFIELVSTSDEDGGYLGFNADLTLEDSYIRLAEPTDGSQIGLDSISGRLRLSHGRFDLQANPSAATHDGDVIVKTMIDINPNCPVSGSLASCGTGSAGNLVAASAANYEAAASEALRVNDINLYPAPTVATPNPAGQRLGELVLTGGKIFTQLTLTPR